MKQNIDEMNKIMDEVDSFAEMMKQILIKPENIAKGGWKDDDAMSLYGALCVEILELREAIIHNQTEEVVQKEAADVANHAMMIADVYRQKKEVKS